MCCRDRAEEEEREMPGIEGKETASRSTKATATRRIADAKVVRDFEERDLRGMKEFDKDPQ